MGVRLHKAKTVAGMPQFGLKCKKGVEYEANLCPPWTQTLFLLESSRCQKIINLATQQTSAELLLKVQKLASHSGPPTTQSPLAGDILFFIF